MKPFAFGFKSPFLKKERVLSLNPISILFPSKSCCPTQQAIWVILRIFPPPPDLIMCVTGLSFGNSNLTISPIFVLTSLRTFKIFISLDSSGLFPWITSRVPLLYWSIISKVFSSAFFTISSERSMILCSTSKSSRDMLIPLSVR